MFIYKVCAALEAAKISYAIVGGYAVALHGAIRGTMDVDIAIRWTLHDLENCEKVLSSLGLVSLIPIKAENLFHFRDEYITERHLIAWNFYDPKNPANQVDIIINYDLHNAKTEVVRTPLGKVRVLSLKDLIAMKKKSGREQDLADIKALEEL